MFLFDLVSISFCLFSLLVRVCVVFCLMERAPKKWMLMMIKHRPSPSVIHRRVRCGDARPSLPSCFTEFFFSLFFFFPFSSIRDTAVACQAAVSPRSSSVAFFFCLWFFFFVPPPTSSIGTDPLPWQPNSSLFLRQRHLLRGVCTRARERFILCSNKEERTRNKKRYKILAKNKRPAVIRRRKNKPERTD